jgi:glycosyltransferase involved in cell wall biosynthesis
MSSRGFPVDKERPRHLFESFPSKRNLHIAVDARTVYSPYRRGTGKNLLDLYRTLARLRPNWNFAMIHQVEGNDDPFEGVCNIRSVRVDMRGDRWNLWQDICLPWTVHRIGASVLHCPANTAPWLSPKPVVLTLHDLIPLELEPRTRKSLVWERRVHHSAKIAARIITPSEYSRKVIIDRLKIREDKIIVNNWAPDLGCRRTCSNDEISSVRAKYAIPPEHPYVLSFGASDPRKNTKRILEAWSMLDVHMRHSTRLVIVGLDPPALNLLKSTVEARIKDDSCLLHGFADEKDLPTLLGNALALCYPSLSEGFGLPLLDAFACGTPAITSCTTSLPEVAGEAAFLVNPEDPKSIASALAEVIRSSETRERLRAAGYERIKDFSWEKCGAAAAGVIEEAASRSNNSYA